MDFSGVEKSTVTAIHTKYLLDICSSDEKLRDFATRYFDEVRRSDPNVFVSQILDVLEMPTDNPMLPFVIWVLLSKETSPDSISTLKTDILDRIMKIAQEEIDSDEETIVTSKILLVIDQIKKSK